MLGGGLLLTVASVVVLSASGARGGADPHLSAREAVEFSAPARVSVTRVSLALAFVHRAANRPHRIHAPVIPQALHNDCEAAALASLLASTGVHAGQRRLQSELPRSGPLDPVWRRGRRIWGDPELGFVGRTDGGGPAGGFGVYQRPVAAVAARHGRPLSDLTGLAPALLYRHLQAGFAVEAWVGLSAGPYEDWLSPTGRAVHVNLGEHTVVLTGIGPGVIRLVNPLHGTRETWTRADFERRWRLLGDRALATG